MKGSDLATILREDYLDDAVNEKLWPDAQLLRHINQAQHEACIRGDFIFDDTTPEITQIALTADKAEYPFHRLITRFKRIALGDTAYTRKTREEMDAQDKDWRIQPAHQDQPIAVVSGRTITLCPTPDAAGTLKLEVYRSPKGLKDIDKELEVIPEYQYDLIHWCLYACYNKRDADTFDPIKAREYLAEFDRIFGPPLDARIRQHQLEAEHIHVLRPLSYTRSSYASTRSFRSRFIDQ